MALGLLAPKLLVIVVVNVNTRDGASCSARSRKRAVLYLLVNAYFVAPLLAQLPLRLPLVAWGGCGALETHPGFRENLASGASGGQAQALVMPIGGPCLWIFL